MSGSLWTSWPALWVRRVTAGSWQDAGSVWLSLRTPRERLILLAGGLILLVALFVVLVWQPLSAARSDAMARIAILDRVVARARTIDPTSVSQSAAPLATPATAITNSAGAFGLSIKRLESEATGTHVMLEDVKFDTLLLWLEKLETEDGLYASSIDLERRPEPGVVAARVTLER